ncbi:MAG: hypothetical protein RMK19_02390 [Bacteroidia bacterium]|nr:hypothetical protein [Bacteroidia bacterium]MDW8014845.1 hypothetical protein [Bacteroidia bacterium]
MHWVILLSGSLLWAQRILSRTQIEVKGYSVEKIGLPLSPTPVGKGRFAYIEYWAQDKPRPGWYIECLNTQYYTQWSQYLEIPKAGEGRPLRLISMKDALIACAYEEDPLTRGVVQLAGRFYDFKGQPLLPKWIPLSVYDRPATDAISDVRLSPDSTHLLWYAYKLGKKGQIENGWYAVWNSAGKKVSSSTQWPLSGTPLSIQLDHKLCIWTIEKAGPKGLKVVEYNTRARTTRQWPINIDTALYAPYLHLTKCCVYIIGLLPGEKGIPHVEGQVSRWAVGRLTFPVSDTSAIEWSIAPIPNEWSSFYPELTHFNVAHILTLEDTLLYILWEDNQIRAGTALSYDVWIVQWSQREDSLLYRWAYRIEKRQREPSPEMTSFIWGLSETFLTIAFLTERTGKGKLIAYLLNHETGEALTKELAQNTAGDLLILPRRTAYLGLREVICLALAPPGKNGYQIYHLRL